MNAISMMELNAKSPLFWDWENLVMPNNNTNTNTNPTTKGIDDEVEAPPKKLHFVVDSNIDAMEGFEPEPGSFYSSGLGSGSGSDLGYVSSSKSSKSGSTDSGCGSDLGHVNSGESLIALELGKRTFFEAGSGNPKTSVPVTSSTAKKIKPSSLSNDQSPRCQVEGCNLDLSSAKDYHRKHRVCENHSKSPKVVVNGLERRFCQQCSRFHSLSEFDQKKRSCRRRLSDHNARRRKPKPEVIQFNSTRIASSLYESRNQLSFAFNQASGSIRAGHSAWTILRDTPAKPGLFTIMKPGCADELHSAQNGLPNPDTKLSSISVTTNLLPSKVSPSDQVFQRGIGSGPMAPQANNMDGAQDLRALSLLSTTSWGSSCEPSPAPSPSPFNQPSSMHQANQASLPQPTPAINTIPLGGGGVSSDYWQPPPISSGPPPSAFQLFKDPNESSFYLY